MNIENTVRTAFLSHYGRDADFVVKAPGRVNLIGEHTDYNDGFVLPCAIEYATFIAVSPRLDGQINVLALDCDNETDSFAVGKEIKSHPSQSWSNYVRGVVDELQKREYQLSGCDICISGNVPQGAGLSSSAALEVGIAYAFNHLCELFIERKEIAKIGQAAENNFVGCNCGIMDQLISAEGKRNHSLLIDCRTLETQAVSMPEDMAIVIINSNKKRGLVDSEYNTRRQQCEEAAEFFGVKALRDVTIEQLIERQAELDPVVAKRAKHVITENTRTLEAAKSLKSHDMQRLSTLMELSHVSMRDDFEITCPEVDAIVDIVKKVINDQGGVRMTGGGFGGCVVTLVPPSLVDAVKQAVESQYEKLTGLKETIYVCKAMDGANQLRGL